MPSDAHQYQEASEQFKVASVRTSWQHIWMLFKIREDSSCLCRHELGRQLAPVRTTWQHHPDAEILDKEITCIHIVSVQTIDDRATLSERSLCYGNYMQT
jgi:hypothetical protein